MSLHVTQSKEYKIQAEQLSVTNTALNTEVTKLSKELETLRTRQEDSTQLTSLQDELERLRAELEEAHAQRKRMEEEHGNEKQGLEQVRERVRDRDGSTLKIIKGSKDRKIEKK